MRPILTLQDVLTRLMFFIGVGEIGRASCRERV